MYTKNDHAAFVASLLYEMDVHPITLEQAAQGLEIWRAEGWEDIPEGLTPEILRDLWNKYLEEAKQ